MTQSRSLSPNLTYPESNTATKRPCFAKVPSVGAGSPWPDFKYQSNLFLCKRKTGMSKYLYWVHWLELRISFDD